jgi:hypothetical protein
MRDEVLSVGDHNRRRGGVYSFSLLRIHEIYGRTLDRDRLHLSMERHGAIQALKRV